MSKLFYQHPEAIVESTNIGEGTRIWAFSHVQHQALIGANCNIGEGCYIENGVTIGNNVVMKNNVSVWQGVAIEDDVFLGPSVVFTNDLFPRAKVYHNESSRTLVKKGASIGANTTIICGNTVGEYAMVGAGSVVTKDVKPYALVYGNPAKFKGWICECTMMLEFDVEGKCECGCSYRKINNNVIERI